MQLCYPPSRVSIILCISKYNHVPCIKSLNACSQSVHNFVFPSHTKNLRIKMYKTVIYQSDCMGAKLGLTLRGMNIGCGF